MRYFLEVSYKGTLYSGYQSQRNANTIQAEIEKAIKILGKQDVILIGSSRTDAGVHALQNYFHFDTAVPVHLWREAVDEKVFLYKVNAILPQDIVVKKLIPVAGDAHCRFDAVRREYKYYIYRYKNPFLKDRAFYFPYKLDLNKMKQAAKILMEYNDFTSFSKKKTQVKTFFCTIDQSEWIQENECLVYHVIANRFLRGMVRALTATMLQVGRSQLSHKTFRKLIEAKDSNQTSFAVPGHGLFLVSVEFPAGYFSS